MVNNSKMCTRSGTLLKMKNGKMIREETKDGLLTKKIFDDPITELKNIKTDWENIKELNSENYYDFTAYHYDHRNQFDDKWFKFVIIKDIESTKYHFWFLPGNEITNKHPMAVVKHLYTYGKNPVFNALIDKILKGKDLNLDEKERLLSLMHVFPYPKNGPRIKRYGCLSVEAAGSGIICTIPKKGRTHQITPYVFLNNKSGHYKCSINRIQTALDNVDFDDFELKTRRGLRLQGLKFAPIVKYPDQETDHKYYTPEDAASRNTPSKHTFVGATACNPTKYTDKRVKDVLGVCCRRRSKIPKKKKQIQTYINSGYNADNNSFNGGSRTKKNKKIKRTIKKNQKRN